MGKVYLLQGKYDLAKEESDKAQRIGPKHLYPYWLGGIIDLDESGDIESAKREFHNMDQLIVVAGIFKGIAHYYHLYGKVLIAQGEIKEGLVALEKALKACPRDESIFFRKELAKNYLKAGLMDKTILGASSLLSLNENDGETLYILGLAYEKGGDLSLIHI